MTPEATADRSLEAPLRGSVLDVLKTLLGDHAERDAVLGMVEKLVARNTELEQRLARGAQRFKTSEKVSKAQLVLVLDTLQRGEGEPEVTADEPRVPDELDQADAALRDASDIDAADDDDLAKLRTRKPRRQPPARTAAPANLRRIDNTIVVPAPQRACPRCGAARVCIGHDVTEVIELIPAEVIVRRDRREKLVCVPCEGELVRAPTGDKIVPSG